MKAEGAADAGAVVLLAPSAVDRREIDVVAVATVDDAVAWLCAQGADDALCDAAP